MDNTYCGLVCEFNKTYNHHLYKVSPDAFKDQDKKIVPVTYDDNFRSVIGSAVIDNRTDGLFANITFNEPHLDYIQCLNTGLYSLGFYANKIEEVIDNENKIITKGNICVILLLPRKFGPDEEVQNGET